MQRLQTLFWSVPLAALTGACSQKPDAFCGAVEAVVVSSDEPVPFGSIANGVREDQLATGFRPPVGFEGAAGCTMGSSRDFHIFECLWMGTADISAPGSSKIADRVEACLAPKGWTKTVTHGNDGVEARQFTHVDERADVTVIYTGAAGIQRDSLMVRRPVP